MLPNSKSDLNSPTDHAASGLVDEYQGSHTSLDPEGAKDLDLETSGILGGDDEDDAIVQKPRKKGVGTGTKVIGAGLVVLLALAGAAYVMQEQGTTIAPVARPLVLDPSLSKPVVPAPVDAVVLPVPTVELPGTVELQGKVVENLTPTVSPISSPPSDPFSASPASTLPVEAVKSPEPLAPSADPFAPKVENVTVVPAPSKGNDILTELPAKKIKTPRVDSSTDDVVKPRSAQHRAKPRVKKPSVLDNSSTVDNAPARERVVPQRNEHFNGYEKLF